MCVCVCVWGGGGDNIHLKLIIFISSSYGRPPPKTVHDFYMIWLLSLGVDRPTESQIIDTTHVLLVVIL